MNNKGFSLFEACIALMIIGLVMTPTIAAYHDHMRRVELDTTAANNFAVSSAIQAFYQNNKRYPCPAPLGQKLGDINYGREAQPGSCLPAGLTPGKCLAGICLANANPPLTGQIVYGAVPFADLQLNETRIYDGWGKRIAYAVTLDMADGGAFPADGSLQIDEINQNTDTRQTRRKANLQPDPADYVVISAGPNGRGAYNPEGLIGSEVFVDSSTNEMIRPCNDLGDLDSENCNNDGIFLVSRHRSLDVGSQRYYDDFVSDLPAPPSNPWNPADNLGGNVKTSLMVGIGTDLVGVQLDVSGTEVPDGSGGYLPYPETVGLDVQGDIRAAKAQVKEICRVDGSNCFSSDVLAGTGHIDCTTNGRGLAGIKNSSGECSQSIKVGASAKSCGNKPVTGIVGGVIQCAP